MQRAAQLEIFSGRALRTLAGLTLLWLAATAPALAQPSRFRPAPGYVQVTPPDPAEGRKILGEFRAQGWGLSGAFYLEFELHVLPRPLRGVPAAPERVVPGRLWGRRNDRGPITRIVLQPGAGDAERRLLVQSGPESALWSWPAAEADHAAGGVSTVGAAALFTPLAGTELTAFDLQMPFIYWSDFVYEGTAPVRGRPAHVFLLYPPAAIVAQQPALAGVRIYLDTEFNALMQAEEISATGAPLKSITVLELDRKVRVAKVIDLRDEQTRNHTQFTVTAVALDQDFAAALFEPASLADSLQPPPESALQRLSP